MKEKGFTTVELIITLLVAAAAFILITTIYTSATRLSDRSDDMLTANTLAYQKLQQYENKSWDQILDTKIDPNDPSNPQNYTGDPEEDFTDTIPASLPGPKSAKVFVDKPGSLAYILIRITYQSISGERTLEYATYIQEGGLGR